MVEKVGAYMIDEPSPFEPLATWQAFLMKMLALPQDDPSVASMVDLAKKMIAEKLHD